MKRRLFEKTQTQECCLQFVVPQSWNSETLSDTAELVTSSTYPLTCGVGRARESAWDTGSEEDKEKDTMNISCRVKSDSLCNDKSQDYASVTIVHRCVAADYGNKGILAEVPPGTNANRHNTTHRGREPKALASLISPLSSQHKPIKLVHYTSAQDVHVSIRSCILSCSKDMSSITFEVNLQKCSDLARNCINNVTRCRGQHGDVDVHIPAYARRSGEQETNQEKKVLFRSLFIFNAVALASKLNPAVILDSSIQTKIEILRTAAVGHWRTAGCRRITVASDDSDGPRGRGVRRPGVMSSHKKQEWTTGLRPRFLAKTDTMDDWE
ncbi:hypothetical protein F2P81_021066 [Scophthalmus maximus]|uniref:Uncharacterized protein n=1 Tax=Scophthalmus maximus TaxID=52904 RepID=A0A6A4S1B7_SCOMX|nr:hypothetical protein F2P81_021066 [Scophthalmus maximus]